MLLIYGNKATWDALSETGLDEVMGAHQELIKELQVSGELVGYAGLTTEDAKVVRLRDGVPAVTDGPFTEAKEVLAGYYLLDCASAERVSELATRLPEVWFSPIEVRRLMDEPGDWL
jgi:hypothetical protein